MYQQPFQLHIIATADTHVNCKCMPNQHIQYLVQFTHTHQNRNTKY